MTAQIIKTESIKETDFSREVKIVTLGKTPTIKEQNDLFGYNTSVILEF